jgi:hypothetical protein
MTSSLRTDIFEEEKKANSNRQQTSAATAARHDTSLRFVPNNDIDVGSQITCHTATF